MATINHLLKEQLRDAAMKAAKEWIKKANVAATPESQEKIVEVFVNLLFGTAELIMEGKNLTPTSVALMMTQRLAEQHMLLDDQLIKCIAASVAFLAAAPKTLSVGKAGGVPGILVAAAWILADAVTPAGECYLYYLNEKGEEQIRALQRSLSARYSKTTGDPLPWDDLEYTPAETVFLYNQLQ